MAVLFSTGGATSRDVELAEVAFASSPERTDEPLHLLLEACHALGTNLVLSWDRYVLAREQLERGIHLYNPQQHNYLKHL